MQASAKKEQVAGSGIEVAVDRTINLDKSGNGKQVMKQYDLHNISYPEIVKMGRDLYNAGVINGEQMLMITAPGGEHLKLVDGKAKLLTSDEMKEVRYEKKDYLKNQELHLAQVEKYQASDFSTVKYARNLVNVLHNLEALAS